MSKKALLLLENGWHTYAKTFASSGTVCGEFVFNTSMTGYQEILTDPSYKGQIILFTYPLIGNYGINDSDNQSNSIKAEAMLIREYSLLESNYRSKRTLKDYLESYNIIGIEGFDTRALTNELRNNGSQQGAISTEHLEIDSLKKLLDEKGNISSKNQFEDVIADEIEIIKGNINSNVKLAAIDFGIKNNIIENLKKYFNTIYLIPFNDNIDHNLKSIEFDGVFFTNGPGDPRILDKTDNLILELAKNNIPLTGICFGHQLIAKAFDLKIDKLDFGHHGANHPVINKSSGKIYITAQNHNYSVNPEALNSSRSWEFTWQNLFDRSVEGMKHKDLPIECVQSQACQF
jgi:carbamoyl-phosphate synthase small subunit